MRFGTILVQFNATLKLLRLLRALVLGLDFPCLAVGVHGRSKP